MSDPGESKFPPSGSDPAVAAPAEKAAALARLAAGMAHDFNNLLMVILGNAELGLLTAADDSPARPALEQILAASQRAADYCKQMMAYAGGLKLALEPIDLAAWLRGLRTSLVAAVPDHAVLRFRLPDTLPAIDADSAQLRQLIEQLLSNAAESLPAGGGSITLSVAAGEFDGRELAGFLPDSGLPAGSYVLLEVADTGSGMDRVTAARALDPFFTTKNKGRGLGMAIVMGIIRGLRGAIRVDSQSGQGTRVRVLFPVSDAAAIREQSQSGLSANWRGSGYALIVEPDDAARVVAAALLEHFGFDCLLAADVPQGIELLREHAGQTTLILLAAAMPPAEVECAAGQLRKLAPEAKVLLAGAGAAVHKPYTAGQLGAQLRAAMDPQG